jgi:thiol:disulfide interchange protein DsbA
MKKLLMLVLLVPLLFACEQNNSIEVNGKTYVGGSDYLVLETPIQFGDSPQSSVIEVFWYGCSHCKDFEPVLQEWIRALPKGSSFGRSPAIWNAAMVVHAKAYYISEHLQLGHQFHMRLFERILNLRSSKDLNYHRAGIASLFAEQGVSQEQFEALLASESIMKQVMASEQLMKEAGIQSTPSFVVSGKYMLTTNTFKTREELLAVAAHLVNLEMATKSID